MRVVGSWISDSDQIDEGVCFLSNLHRWLRDEQTRTAPVGNDAGAIEESSGLRVGMTAHRSTVTRALRCIKHDGDRGKMERGSGGGVLTYYSRWLDGRQLRLAVVGRLLQARVMMAAHYSGDLSLRERWGASQWGPRPSPSLQL
jgi:hypothetical protein